MIIDAVMFSRTIIVGDNEGAVVMVVVVAVEVVLVVVVVVALG